MRKYCLMQLLLSLSTVGRLGHYCSCVLSSFLIPVIFIHHMTAKEEYKVVLTRNRLKIGT